jgi:prevent-host-death family protein
MAIHIKATNARNKLSELLRSVRFGKEEVIIERFNKPMAALIPIETYERFIEERRIRFEVLDTIRSHTPDISSDEIEKDISEAVSLVRESRAESSS